MTHHHEHTRRIVRRTLVEVIRYVVVLFVLLAFLMPFAWMFLASVKSPGELLRIPIQWLPDVWRWDNYRDVVTMMPFSRAFFNTTLVSTAITVSVIVTSSLAGFALAKYDFWGKDIFFKLVLASMMLPLFIVLIPQYFIVHQLGWVDTYWSLIVPGAVFPFGIFLMRQFVISMVPDELIDAARIDGCSELGIFLRIVIPLCRPAWVVLGVLVFMHHWNDFVWPLIVLQSRDMFTLQLLLSSLQDAMGSVRFYPLMMAGTVLAIIPTTILFLLAQRHIVEGVSQTGFK